MSEHSRSFSLSVHVPISGISLVTRTGPLIEAWNRRYDRKAAVGLHSKTCNGETVTSKDAYKTGSSWVLHFQMTGLLSTDERIAELSALLLDAINTVPTSA